MLVSTFKRVNVLVATAIVTAIVAGTGSARIVSASTVPSPALAKFLPVDYRVTAVKDVNLDGSRIPQVAATAVGPVDSSGFATSLVLVLAWDSYVKRWTSVYNTLNEPSWQTSSQFGKGPGLLNATDEGPQIRVVHDQPRGRVDLLYWLDSIAGNTNYLIVGVVHVQHQIATPEFSFGQSYGHVFSMDQTSHASVGAAVIGASPHQRVKITLPWLTAVDSESQAARMYYFTIAPFPKSFDEYEIIYNNQSYAGVGLDSSSGNHFSTVGYIDPNSPANGKLRVGDVIEDVAGSKLPAKDAVNLLGPKVIEEVALYRPGQTIELNVLRRGQPLIVKLKLAQWPISQTSNYITTSSGADLLM